MTNRLTVGVMLLVVLLNLPSPQKAPPCDNWTLHTRTLPSICPEVIAELPSAQGVAAVWGLAFDQQGALLFTRPATGQVMRMTHQAERFDPPQVVAESLALPFGIACAADACYVATETAILRLNDQAVILAGLPTGEARSLHIGVDGSLYTTRVGQLIRFARDGSGLQAINTLAAPVADFDWSAGGTLWASDDANRVRSAASTIPLTPDSHPQGITFYRGNAFPQFRNGLLIVTAGSWNTPTIAGYELLFVPFEASGLPSAVMRLIPANTERSSSDAALAALSFFPDHPVSVAVDANGWIYVAVREGRIIRLRPRA